MSSEISFSALAGANALYAALRGDMSLLVARLRSGEALSPKEQSFLADFLEGRINGIARRGRQERKAQEKIEIAQFVIVTQEAMGGSQTAAIVEASQHFGCSERKVETALATYRQMPGHETFRRLAQAIGRNLKDSDGDPQKLQS